MSLLFTRWLYPLREPIVLLENPNFVLDNPRSDEVEKVASLLDESYHLQLKHFFSPSDKEEYISLEWIVSRFTTRFGGLDPYIEDVLMGQKSESVFESLSRIWIVARYDDEGMEKELELSAEQMRKDGEFGFFLLEDDNPITRNSTKLKNYLSLLSLLINSEGDEFFGNPILVNSTDSPMAGLSFDENLWRNAFIMFLIFATSDDDTIKSDKLAWTCFPYVRGRLLEVIDAVKDAFSKGHGDLLMYIGNILRVAEHDAKDIRVRFFLLVSLLELVLTHNPDTSRYNVEDSINRQFRLKTGIMVRLQHPEINLSDLERRLKQLYSLRSAIAHGNFKAIFKYEQSLSKKEGKEEYFDDVVTDTYFYLRASLEQFLKDPDFVQFVKKS